MNRGALEYVSVCKAAAQLSISSSSIQRMCDRGQLAFEKTTGGHRRISVASLRALAQQTPVDQEFDFRESLLKGDSTSILRWLQNVEDRKERIVEQIEQGLCRVLHELDIDALKNLIDQNQLWLAVETARTALDSLAASHTNWRTDSLVAVGGTIKGNNDRLATRIIELCLRLCSIRAIDLGCNLSPTVLAQAANDLGAKWIWISHTHIHDFAATVMWYHELTSLVRGQVELLVGGGALSPAVRRAIPKHRYFETLGEMMRYVEKSDRVRRHARAASSIS